jgi:hypothetical protein
VSGHSVTSAGTAIACLLKEGSFGPVHVWKRALIDYDDDNSLDIRKLFHLYIFMATTERVRQSFVSRPLFCNHCLAFPRTGL